MKLNYNQMECSTIGCTNSEDTYEEGLMNGYCEECNIKQEAQDD